MQVHFDYMYSPKPRYSQKHPHIKLSNILSASNTKYIQLVQKWISYSIPLNNIKTNQADVDAPIDPYWENGFFSSLDAISLFCLLATTNPEIYLEVGSGNSTKFARLAIKTQNLDTKIISIDPNPRAEIDQLCDTIIREPVEDIHPSFFHNLPSSTLVFVDNSHRSFQNSDVTTFFLEILPSLKKGIIFGLHDIFLPYDYPASWIEEKRFYNEQYLLASYILGGHCDSEILFPCYHVVRSKEFSSALQPLSQILGGPLYGGCFWLQKTISPTAHNVQAGNAVLESWSIQPNETIDVKDPRFPLLLKKGWATPERTHVWSNDPSPILSVNPEGLGEKFSLTLSFFAFVCRQHPTQEFQFFDRNGTLLARQTASYPKRAYAVTLPLDVSTMRSPTGTLDVFLSCKDAVRPESIRYSPDTRLLGLALTAITASPGISSG